MVQLKVIAAILLIVPCLRAGLHAKNPEKVDALNLMHTFGSQEEIPAAFLEARSDQQIARKIYRACQDGSGGLCVPQGECPPALRPETNTTATNACDPGLECCFGPPASDKSCSSRGGECLTPSICGGQPVYKEAVDCDTQKGQICCILT